MNWIDTSRQRYLDMIHRYLQGRLDYFSFRMRLRSQWAEERDALWRWVWQAARTQRCLEREQLIKGEVPCASPSDPRRFPRMLDRLCALCIKARQEEPFRASVQELLTVYRGADADLSEARYLLYPPRIYVFERPLPSGSNHRYSCTVEDIRRQLARVPEYALEGLWAIGLSPAMREDVHSYGVYYRWLHVPGKPVILLHSAKGTWDFKLRYRSDPGYIKQRFRVERSYGMEIEHLGSRVLCRWPDECLRRYLVEHVLLHEIGHHVQYQERWREGARRWLPFHIKEQFAEDYAIRFHREQAE